jgi:hypothetical protein
VHAVLRRCIYLFAPSLQRVPWPPLSGALRFPAFTGSMGSYDCSPVLPCRLRSPLATGTPPRGSVRFPWDALVSLGTWFHSGWAEPRPPRGEIGSSPGFTGIPFESMPRARDSGDPKQPRSIGYLDAAFRQANGVGVAMTNDVGAEPSRPASSLCTLPPHQSPGERQHSLPACLLCFGRAGLAPAGLL